MALKSWLDIPSGCHFSLSNLPMGIISHSRDPEWAQPRPAMAIGDFALDLKLFTANNGFRDLSIIQPHSTVLSEGTLNAFAALGRPIHATVRKYIQSVFLLEGPYPEVLKDNHELRSKCLIPLKDVEMRLPFTIPDYTDFFTGLNHAYNCGVLFRGPENALNPNYKHLPVAYHGRASSVVASGTPVRRPRGQILVDATAETKKPVYAPSRRLDFELELAAFVCKPNVMGDPIDVNKAEEHLFGVVLMNDWSARDVQSWEYVPLGPFNAKNFGTSISPWVVLMDALEPFRAKGIENDTEALAYLKQSEQNNAYDIKLTVDLEAEPGTRRTITETSATNLLFSFPQMLAHHTSTGCPMSVGDLIGTGTISGTVPQSCGSLLEQSRGGQRAVSLANGSERMFLEDGDTVTFKGVCGDKDEALVGFGECIGTIMPAHVS
ncbi:MAG: hypothetical protein M1831_005888 [Alyxoria varia]|nr:MAG: hypothetical protein M1831_005888 [Alyxoria varia]